MEHLRINQLYLTESILPKNNQWSISDAHLFLGSCFANEVGGRLKDNGVNSLVNPFGVLFHPHAILKCLSIITGTSKIENKHIIERDELFFSLDLHSSIYASTYSAFIDNYQSIIKNTKLYLNDVENVVITLGTAFYYELKSTEKPVVNCQKLPQNQFEKKLASVDEVTLTLVEIEKCLKTFNPSIDIVFTVSPIRHKKEGLHENNLSKSTLLLGLDQFLQGKSHSYFPTYEMAIDSLRDYRFYKQDLVHLSEEAIGIILDHFVSYAYSKNSIDLLDKVSKVRKENNHKLLTNNSEAGKKFLENLELKKKRITERLPYFKW